MARDTTRNIETFKTGGTQVNEFEFHKHQGEMTDKASRTGHGAETDAKPLTRAEQIAKVTEQAHQKVQRRKKKVR